MKKKAISESDDPLDGEFDFTKARPNPYWLGVADRRCVTLIEKDLAEIFPDNESVNAALRSVRNQRHSCGSEEEGDALSLADFDDEQ